MIKTPPKNRLRVLRAERRLSQRDTAVKARMQSFDRYWRIEAGYAVPTEDEQAALAKVFRVPVDEVFPGASA